MKGDSVAKWISVVDLSVTHFPIDWVIDRRSAGNRNRNGNRKGNESEKKEKHNGAHIIKTRSFQWHALTTAATVATAQRPNEHRSFKTLFSALLFISHAPNLQQRQRACNPFLNAISSLKRLNEFHKLKHNLPTLTETIGRVTSTETNHAFQTHHKTTSTWIISFLFWHLPF